MIFLIPININTTQKIKLNTNKMQVLNYENDAKALREAMRGMGTDEEALIQITGTRSNKDRQGIRQAYKAAYGRDLLEDLQNELSGDFLNVIEGMYMSPVEFDVLEIYNACKGAGTDEDTLSEIIGSRSNYRLREVKTAYKLKYGEDLEIRIKDETSGDYRKLMCKQLKIKIKIL